MIMVFLIAQYVQLSVIHVVQRKIIVPNVIMDYYGKIISVIITNALHNYTYKKILSITTNLKVIQQKLLKIVQEINII